MSDQYYATSFPVLNKMDARIPVATRVHAYALGNSCAGDAIATSDVRLVSILQHLFPSGTIVSRIPGR